MFTAISKWRIWGILGALIVGAFGILTFMYKHQKAKVDALQAENKVAEVNVEVKEFQAVNIEREKEAQNGKMDIKPNTTYSF